MFTSECVYVCVCGGEGGMYASVVSMVKGVLSQSSSSLNTISEEGVCSPVGREVLEGWRGGGCVIV